MEKMREEFEAFYSKEFGFREDDPENMFSMFCDDGEFHDYYRLGVRTSWKSWKASRAAQCVELPRCWNDEQRDYRDDLVKRLDAAGIRYV